MPSVLVFRNSYFKQLKGLVPEHFSRTTVVWSELDLPRALREAPDIVIGQITF